jgi:4-hydroxy-3-polyprenylbenzoate decarboxylase
MKPLYPQSFCTFAKFLATEYETSDMPLSSFIHTLERADELHRINAYVSPAYDMAEITDRICKNACLNKALLFTNNGTEFPVLMNAMGSERRICMALGVKNLDEITTRIEQTLCNIMKPKISLWDKLKLLPTLKQAAQWLPAHVHAPRSRITMQAPDLHRLPITTSWAADGAPFLTLPMVHTQDISTGARNVGMYRMQVFDGQTTAMHWHVHKTGARHFQQYKAAQRRMPVAVALGGDPVYAYCATAPMPDGVDEYLLAGFLRNKPVRLMPCISQPLYVPEDADFVIEGYIDPQEPLSVEGPFGDHTGFYSLPDLYPLFHVTAITHTPDAVYPATLVGVPPQEDAYLAMATERIFLPLIRTAILPEIVDMYMPAEGVAHNFCVVKIKKQYEGHAQKVANALWGAGQMMFNKILVVTDDDVDVNIDVDIRNVEALMNVVAERFNPHTDIYFGYGTLDVLDHSSCQCGYGSKMCVDLTRKYGIR